MENKMELQELSLLTWLSRGNKDNLIELMCKYTGCEPDVYTNDEIISLFERALIDISRKYYIKGLLNEYFTARREWKTYASIYPNKYTEIDAEIDALGTALFSVYPKVFDQEDKLRIEELRKEYMEE